MENPDLSLAFYHYLCDVIGTEEVVNRRRHIFTTVDNVNSNKHSALICSGSKAEGLELNGSDFDLMVLENCIHVYENKDSVRQLGKTEPFVMDTSDSKPGFTKLKQHYSYNRLPWCEYKAGVWYLSSSKFREDDVLSELKDRLITNGPCISSRDGTRDYARCVRCKDWIFQAQPWILRSNNLCVSIYSIETIVEFGVLFVPVGCKNSPNVDLEWRISFSYAEKLLIWSFNHVQLLCYTLLKILLKDIIKQTTGNLLCSYFLKTVMLWICEETKSSQWKENNILFCFMSCFNRLIYCVQYKTCVHYFIPENVFFAERFDEQQHNILLSTLNHLKCLGWKCLFQTKTLKSFRDVKETVPSPLKLKVYYFPNLSWLDIVRNNIDFSELKKSVYFCILANKKVFYIYMISKISRYYSQVLTLGDKRLRDNKKSYIIYRKRLCHLLIGLHHDAVSGWLLLASFFYVNKQYQIFRPILTDCLLWFTREKAFLIPGVPTKEQKTFTCLHGYVGFKPMSVLRTYVINYVDIAPSSHIVPNEMLELVDGKGGAISPVGFALFLKFLCSLRFGNQTEIKKSLRELEIVLSRSQHKKAAKLLSIAYCMRRETN